MPNDRWKIEEDQPNNTDRNVATAWTGGCFTIVIVVAVLLGGACVYAFWGG